jgi:flagellar motor switch/type III secretory pathway protein FliN
LDVGEKEPLSHQLELAEQESKAIKDVTMQVSVEIARLKITLDQLMNLSPGNFLELPPYADKKVSLTVNGQKVGVAEILHLGETIGLKILEI